MPESTQKKLGRVRPPRVVIQYDVETGDASVKKELPFVVGVLGDFSGQPTEKLKPLKDRKFVAIDRDNFDQVMRDMKPGLNLKVENTIQNDGSELAVNLKFSSMADFEPARIVEQVEPLKKLMDERNRLKAIQSMADRDDRLEDLVGEVVRRTESEKPAEKDGDA